MRDFVVMGRKRLFHVDFVPVGSRLVFLSQVDGKTAMYRCTCGIVKKIVIYKANTGETKSCGCYQREVATINASTLNGLSNHPLWSKWRDVWNRCYRENVKSYPLYGGNGVEMCEEWRDDFMAFYNWCMSNGWKPGLQIDKDIIPKKLGIPAKLYGPDVCCFVTCKTNNNNRKSNYCVEFNGVIKTVAQWSEEYSINQHTLWGRINRKWPIEKALTMHTKLTGKRKC